MRITLCLLLVLAWATGSQARQLAADSSWHMQLNGELQRPDRHVYDIDLFDTSAGTIAALKDEGRMVICYFSAGTWEDWREDAASVPAAARGKALDEWPGEYWLDIRRNDVRELLRTRLDLAREKGCDGVDPDNVDGYANDNGLGLTQTQQVAFNLWLAARAHDRGLIVGLKNAVDLLPQLAASFDFAVNESCYQYDECAGYSQLRQQGKAVFIAEYRRYDAELCERAKDAGFNLQFFRLELDDTGQPCH